VRVSADERCGLPGSGRVQARNMHIKIVYLGQGVRPVSEIEFHATGTAPLITKPAFDSAEGVTDLLDRSRMADVRPCTGWHVSNGPLSPDGRIHGNCGADDLVVTAAAEVVARLRKCAVGGGRQFRLPREKLGPRSRDEVAQVLECSDDGEADDYNRLTLNDPHFVSLADSDRTKIIMPHLRDLRRACAARSYIRFCRRQRALRSADRHHHA
jgi:hypothetical protein